MHLALTPLHDKCTHCTCMYKVKLTHSQLEVGLLPDFEVFLGYHSGPSRKETVLWRIPVHVDAQLQTFVSVYKRHFQINYQQGHHHQNE